MLHQALVKASAFFFFCVFSRRTGTLEFSFPSLRHHQQGSRFKRAHRGIISQQNLSYAMIYKKQESNTGNTGYFSAPQQRGGKSFCTTISSDSSKTAIISLTIYGSSCIVTARRVFTASDIQKQAKTSTSSSLLRSHSSINIASHPSWADHSQTAPSRALPSRIASFTSHL